MEFVKSISSPSAFTLWFAAITYILLLGFIFGFIISGNHLPIWAELILKSTAVLAFAAIVLLPALHAVGTRIQRKEQSKALAIAAHTSVAGYTILFGMALYAKLKTCDINAVSHDDRWHCNVEGKDFIVYFLLIPIIAAITGVLVGGIGWIIRKQKHQ